MATRQQRSTAGRTSIADVVSTSTPAESPAADFAALTTATRLYIDGSRCRGAEPGFDPRSRMTRSAGRDTRSTSPCASGGLYIRRWQPVSM
jgi:hypothetical protein